ncbi:MAG: GNAT family N-acetyltransferase [Flavobacterium sp.]|nr:MAG: GNAT family N-acetyltransferase [Flavobacterium sp.]
MVDIKIVQLTLSDIEDLKEIGKSTFIDTFASDNNLDDMNKYLDEAFSNEKLTAEISNSASKFYFAKLDQDIIGYLKLNLGAAQTELQDDKSLEIERIYVSKEYHGKKVGQMLYAKALGIANELKVDYVWLGVWEKNQRAISFYKKNGFVEFDKHVFKLGDDQQTDIMMRLKLQAI